MRSYPLQAHFFVVIFLHVLRNPRQLIQMALLPDAALVVLLFHEPGDQQVKQLQEQAPDLQLIPKPFSS